MKSGPVTRPRFLCGVGRRCRQSLSTGWQNDGSFNSFGGTKLYGAHRASDPDEHGHWLQPIRCVRAYDP